MHLSIIVYNSDTNISLLSLLLLINLKKLNFQKVARTSIKPQNIHFYTEVRKFPPLWLCNQTTDRMCQIFEKFPRHLRKPRVFFSATFGRLIQCFQKYHSAIQQSELNYISKYTYFTCIKVALEKMVVCK